MMIHLGSPIGGDALLRPDAANENVSQNGTGADSVLTFTSNQTQTEKQSEYVVLGQELVTSLLMMEGYD
ncbi:hypothetical protein [Chitinophaga arvensicola]|uniref:Uncharacterized protein n=1 Tax=Chitinophaga arvensicola TaxID=29529 RepID=A0A1I0S7B8_9BACT|nr:hypothetical protein [Chitinophaga arvensicola]SEW51576.1 hypothetical protein SAMN04488122_4332 [Chitinophaga arvensicola]